LSCFWKRITNLLEVQEAEEEVLVVVEEVPHEDAVDLVVVVVDLVVVAVVVVVSAVVLVEVVVAAVVVSVVAQVVVVVSVVVLEVDSVVEEEVKKEIAFTATATVTLTNNNNNNNNTASLFLCTRQNSTPNFPAQHHIPPVFTAL
jgi:hypothetical protein